MFPGFNSMSRLAEDDKTSRRLRQRVLGLREPPVEPLRQRLDVGRLDGRTAPDAQSRRRVAVGVDVVGDVFPFESRRKVFHKGSPRVGGECRYCWIDNLQADRSV